VMVWDEHDLVAVPDLGVLAEVLLEDADGAGAADVVRHEHVDVHPDVVARRRGVTAGGPGQDLFGHRLRRHSGISNQASGKATSLYSHPAPDERRAVIRRRLTGR